MDKNDTPLPPETEKNKTTPDSEGLSLELDSTDKVKENTPKEEHTGISLDEETTPIQAVTPLINEEAPTSSPAVTADDNTEKETEVDEEDTLVATNEQMLGIDAYNEKQKSNTKLMILGAAVIVLGLSGGAYYMFMKPDPVTTATAETNPYTFADTIDDDMPGFEPDNLDAQNNNASTDDMSLGFSAPPQPDTTSNENNNIPVFPDSDTAYVKEASEVLPSDNKVVEIGIESTPTDIGNTALPIEEMINVTNDTAPQTLGIDESYASIDTSNNDILSINPEPVDVLPPTDDELGSSILDEENDLLDEGTNLTLNNNIDFDDTPEISNVEQVPDGLSIIPPQMPSPDDLYASVQETSTYATPDKPKKVNVANKTSAIPDNITEESRVEMPSKGVLNSDITENIKDTMREMPAREALIRPIPKKYFLIKVSHSNKNSNKANTKRATNALNKGNPGAALGILDKMSRINPGSKDILMKKAIAYQQMGNTKAALRAYETVLRQDPADLDALTNMLGLLRKDKPKLALSKLNELREIYPTHPGIAAQLAITYGELKHYKDALRNLDIAMGLDKQNAYYSFNKAVILDHMGKRGPATEMYKKALNMHRKGHVGSQVIPINAILKRLHIVY